MVNLRTLGIVDLTDRAGVEITSVLSQPKRLGLLVYLASPSPGTLHRRDTLLALFWPDSDPVRARNSLSQSLSYLRKNLPEGVFISRGSEEVGLSGGAIDLDVAEFESALAEKRWADALTTYRGGFLEGFHVGGAWGFEEWMELERERLRERASGAAWLVAQEQLERGVLVEAERTAQKAMDLVYTDESPVRKFIEALARAGDCAAALNFYERFSTRLREKLDLEPSPQTAKVAEDIRNGDLVPAEDARAQASRRAPDDVEGGRGIEALHGKRRNWIPALVGFITMSVLAVLFWPAKESSPAADLVAVVPFSNQTGDSSFDPLGEEISRGIEGMLGRAGVGAVIPWHRVQESLSAAGSTVSPIRVLPGEVGAGVVVSGSIVFLGEDSLLIRASCLNGRTEEEIYQVPAARGRRAERSHLVSQIQDRIAASIAQHLDTEFALDPAIHPPPLTLEAYQEYRRGFEVYRLGGTPQEAREHFHRALEMDSTYLAPPLRLMAAYSARPHRRAQYDSILSVLEPSRHKMTRYQRHYYDGIRLSSEGQQELAYREFLAMAELGRNEAASGLAEMALLTNHIGKSVEAAGWLDLGNGAFLEPFVTFWQGYWSLYTYALHLGESYRKELEITREWQDRFPAATRYPVSAKVKALVGLGRLEDLEPIIGDWRAEKRLQSLWMLADELWVHGHKGAAQNLLEEEVQRFGTDSAYIGRYNNQAMVLHRLGRNEEAHALWEVGVNLNRETPWAWGVGRIGFSAALVGDSAQAREMERLLMSLDGLPPADEIYVPFLQAKIAAALGEKDRAVRILEEWGRRGTLLFWLNNLHGDFTFQSLLGDDPRFQELMRPKG